MIKYIYLQMLVMLVLQIASCIFVYLFDNKLLITPFQNNELQNIANSRLWVILFTCMLYYISRPGIIQWYVIL
jgi:hypothetical protein